MELFFKLEMPVECKQAFDKMADIIQARILIQEPNNPTDINLASQILTARHGCR